MLNTLIESAGVALVAAFAFFVWHPLPLAVGGVWLVLTAMARERSAAARKAKQQL